ncbi:MAG: hypothetical protein [Caudoviricetes sp.]|nr:MAG: hypothetical protein [Caudoviricetes sp.]
MSYPFEDALTFMKRGDKVCRSGWNGKGLSARIADGTVGSVSVRMFVLESPSGLNSWVPSSSDLLATDWEISQ